MDKKDHGLTDNQKDMVTCFTQGLADAEIAQKMGVSRSTVRNYRFTLRERAKQARVFLAIWTLTDKQTPQGERFIQFPSTTTVKDERLAITEKENRDIIRACFHADGQKLKHFPKKQKKKVAIQRHIMGRFAKGRRYSEKEINSILKSIYSDHVSIRRYLIDYGFLDREKNGAEYWVKEK
ncbi:MAG: DUF2087 domain-containing protein [Planctomycetes bacterium]|nr:DUF2087 domain-containing protein [Planctomycetota bacterium]